MTRVCPGPLPVRVPRLKPPPGACDSHIHVMGPYDRFPLNEDRSYTAPESPIGDYRAIMQALGTERVVIVQPGAHGFNNDLTLDAVAQIGEALRIAPPQ